MSEQTETSLIEVDLADVEKAAKKARAFAKKHELKSTNPKVRILDIAKAAEISCGKTIYLSIEDAVDVRNELKR